ncbi:MAG: hypothetical protein ABIN94_05470 [Ferruginibacter sp.]
MRKWIAIAGLILIFSCVAGLFWFNEWKYSLPTPVPQQYHAVKANEYVDITGKFVPTKNGPVFLHFFNPDCPCSRFNIPHFKTLALKYADKINFAIVVMTTDKSYTEESIRRKYGVTVPVLFDTSLAGICGVYSTPQAVLLNNDHMLYYRGNYNRDRYCTDVKSNYAQIAIESLLDAHISPTFNRYALTAYGCSLPTCKR